jgi:hypothetical protein
MRSIADKCTQSAHSSASGPLAFRRSTAARAGVIRLNFGPALHEIGTGLTVRSPGSELLAVQP